MVRAVPAAIVGIAALGLFAAWGTRYRDRKEDGRAWADLASARPAKAIPFTPEMVADLPDPARRYFTYAIAPGTPLRTIVEIEMEGEIGLGDQANPKYQSMVAREILAPPQGFVWMPQIGSGLSQVTGSDACVGGNAWTRFWLINTVPVARTAPSHDLVRSARARAVAEALWAPASLLPINGAAWEAIDQERARVVFEVDGERYALALSVAEDGQPRSVVMQRWTNANPDGVFRYQPFGATVLEMGHFEGYRIPTRIDGGNGYGTDVYFPFFRARVTGARFQ